MGGSLRRYGLTVLLAGLCVALGGALWWPADPPPRAVLIPVTKASAPPAIPPEPSIAQVVKADFSIVADRPVLQPSRRPFVPAVAAAPPQPAPAPPPPPAIRAYTVVGVMMSGGRRLAWLKSPSGGSPARVAEGDVVQGWRVKHIESDRVTFEAGTAEQVLSLPKRGAAASSPSGGKR